LAWHRGDTDPRGLPVLGADGQAGGTVVDVWVDRSEVLFRYIEVEAAASGRRVLLPINFARVSRDKVKVRCHPGPPVRRRAGHAQP
jgi:photosynthetic reaction center H subunit